MSYTSYPNSIDTSTELPIVTDNVTPVNAEVVNRHRDAVLAVETELGVLPSGTYATVRARLDALEAILNSLAGVVQSQMLVLDSDVEIRSNVNRINFTGAGVAVTSAVTAGQVDVLIEGGAEELVQKQETIAVSLNGQTDFTLTEIPLDSIAVEMYINGIKQQYGVQYTVVADDVTYAGAVSLVTTDIVEFWYIVAGTGGGGGGGEDLAETLAYGNITGGNGIIITSGDTITASDGTVVIDDNLRANGGLAANEFAAVPVVTSPGVGTFWVKDDSPNIPIFTDDVGTDHNLLATGTAGDKVFFKLSGLFSGATVPGTFDPSYPVLDNGTINSVTMQRRTAGSGGTTRVDVQINGVSIFASTAVQPQLDYTAGDNATDSRTVFVSGAITGGDYIDVILEETETGDVEGLTILVEII